MDEPASTRPRWRRLAMNARVPFPAADASLPANTPRTYDLTSAAGETIGAAVAVVDVRRRLITVGEIRYDANKATGAEARLALDRLAGGHR